MTQKGQSRKMSLFETFTNTMVGFWLAVIANMLVFPLFGLPAPFVQSCWIAVFFTVLSMVRQYFMRRFFNWLHVHYPEFDKEMTKWLTQKIQILKTLLA